MAFFFFFLGKSLPPTATTTMTQARRPRKPLKPLLGDTGVAPSDSREKVFPRPVGNSPRPMVVAAFWGNLPPPKNPTNIIQVEKILVLWAASFGGKKNTTAVVFFFSNQLNTIFCIGCLFLSFFLSFFLS